MLGAVWTVLILSHLVSSQDQPSYFRNDVTKRRTVFANREVADLPRYCLYTASYSSCMVRIKGRWISVDKLPGDDDLSAVSHAVSPDLRRSVLDNVVRVGDRCTGTLISPVHVLTAAHCVHNGRQFLPGIRKLKVGVVTYSGRRRVHYISSVYISPNWRRVNSPQDKLSGDFAVLKLHMPVSGDRQFLRLDTGEGQMTSSRIYFTGVHAASGGGGGVRAVWQSSCRIRPDTERYRHLLFTVCHGEAGMTGAAAYVEDLYGRRVFGLVILEKGSQGSVIAKLSRAELARICAYMGPVATDLDLCPDTI